jgi:2-keto-4-pentenoate hydratase
MLEDLDRYAKGMDVQLIALRAALASGMPRRGWKVGINVPEVLTGLKLAHSGVGWIRGDRVHGSGARLVAKAGDALAIEPEIAIHVAHDLPASASPEAARASIAGISPALEVVNYTRPKGGLDEVVAHAYFHEASVLGAMHALEDAEGLGEEWPLMRSATRECPRTRSDLVPTDLARHALFVAEFLEHFGEALLAGDLILSGSYTPRALDVDGPLALEADYGPLGVVAASFEVEA